MASIAPACADVRFPFSRALVGLSALLALGVGVVGRTLDDYGISWDEPLQSRYGEAVVAHWSGETAVDWQAPELYNARFYGPPVEALAALLYRDHPQAKYRIRHLLSAGLALATLPAVFGFGLLLGSPGLGLLAAWILATLPLFHGHAFVNSKDIPFACALSWALLGICALSRLPLPALARGLAVGLLLGVAAAIRPGGLPLFALFAGCALALHAGVTGDRRVARRGLIELPVGLSVAWLVMIAAWPWAQQRPLHNPLQAIRLALDFEPPLKVFYAGRLHASNALPRLYVPISIAITTPLPLLLLLAPGLRWLAGLWRRRQDSRSACAGFVLVWLLAPPLSTVLLHPPAYGGARHFLFVLPALALVTAAGALDLLARAGSLRRFAAPLLGLVLALPLHALWSLHPYSISYFNALVGGTRGAVGRFEVEPWGTSQREAIAWIDAQSRGEPAGSVRVLIEADRFSIEGARFFAGPALRLEALTAGVDRSGDLPAGIDYYVGLQRHGREVAFPGAQTAYAVARAGAVFAVVKRAAPDPAAASRGAAGPR